jgi:hypothetical protein
MPGAQHLAPINGDRHAEAGCRAMRMREVIRQGVGQALARAKTGELRRSASQQSTAVWLDTASQFLIEPARTEASPKRVQRSRETPVFSRFVALAPYKRAHPVLYVP